MRKKTLVLSAILIVGLGAGASANMLIHWSLDESSGTIAHDSVGENHGTLRGNTVWAPAGGKFGGAAVFDGADDSIRLTVPTGPFPFSAYPFTLMGWCKTTKSSAKAVTLAVVQSTNQYYWIGVVNGRGCVTARSTPGQFEQTGGPTISNDQWHHLCGVYFGPNNRKLYVDGVEATTDTRTIEFLTGIRHIAAGALDRDPAGTNIVDEMLGSVDELAIFDEALNVDTITSYMVHGIPVGSRPASQPNPADRATDVPRDTGLSWLPDEAAKAHDVYFGAVLADVEAADRANPKDVLLSKGQTDTVYAPKNLPEYGQTYYWRIDEVNEAAADPVVTGNIWSFTIEPYTYPIAGVIATASSSATDMGPQNAVNGSGMTGDVHSKKGTEMWLSSPTGPQPTWIQFEFDKVYKLGEMWVWNANQEVEAFVGFGAKGVTVEYSANGAAWTPLADVPEFVQAAGTDNYAHGTTINFAGAPAKFVKLTINSNWGTLKQYGLSEVRFHYVPVQARLPEPAVAKTGVSVDAELNWRPGREATSHKVYLSSDRDAVAGGSVPAATVAEHSYTPTVLNFGTAYFWKVEEVGDTGVYPGEVWNFTTQEYAMIDDFEGYTDDEGSRIYQAWIDGMTSQDNGSIVGYIDAPFAEKTIVHGTGQSMPFEYNNSSAPFYSEAERTFDTPQDWTTNGADTLSLYLRGNPTDFLQKADGSIVMGASGADIWGSADQFRYAYKQLTGDGSIVARVDSMVTANAWTKVGVMIRETLDAGSPHVSVVVTPSNGVSFLNRPTAGAASVQVNQTGLVAPYWVKLTRTGNTFTAQRSADGVAWTNITTDPAASTVTVSMAADVYIGLAVTSHNTGMQTSAQFSNVSTAGTVTGQWQNLAIGVAQRSNGPATFYITIEDKSGRKKTVSHPDPQIVTALDWQQWKIPLSEFSSAGVNVAAVKRLIIGAGDRANPTAGGAGLLFIDDIGYGHPLP